MDKWIDKIGVVIFIIFNAVGMAFMHQINVTKGKAIIFSLIFAFLCTAFILAIFYGTYFLYKKNFSLFNSTVNANFNKRKIVHFLLVTTVILITTLSNIGLHPTDTKKYVNFIGITKLDFKNPYNLERIGNNSEILDKYQISNIGSLIIYPFVDNKARIDFEIIYHKEYWQSPDENFLITIEAQQRGEEMQYISISEYSKTYCHINKSGHIIACENN